MHLFSKKSFGGLAGVLLLSLFISIQVPLIANAEANLDTSPTTRDAQYGDTGGSGSGSTAAGSGVSGVAACTISMFSIPGGSIIASFLAAILGNSPSGIPVHDTGTHTTNGAISISTNLGLGVDLSNLFRDDFLNCIARALARAMLQQMTTSVVNWVNSGFNGQPSFVSNYDSFFANVGDQAIGQVIAQSQGLAFLCSPYQLQVRIALAQIYAQNNSANTCSLTKIVGNVNGFLNNFNQGGWPAFLALTTTPTNNIYGSLLQAQSVVEGARAQAIDQQRFDLLLGRGFLSAKYPTSCQNVTINQAAQLPPQASSNQTVTLVKSDGDTAVYSVCQQQIGTPGSAIAGSLDKTLGTNVDSLNTAKYFDEIISALISQIVTQTLNKGLSGLSSTPGGYGGTGITDAFSTLKQDLLNTLPTYRDAAQQIIDLDNKNISDIQSTIAQLQVLKDCWNGKLSTSTPLEMTDSQRQQAQLNASTTETTIEGLQAKIDHYRQDIAQATSTIAEINDFEARASAASTANDLEVLSVELTQKTTSNEFMNQSNIANAQEDQNSLEGDLGTINSQTADNLNQCNAFPTRQTTNTGQ